MAAKLGEATAVPERARVSVDFASAGQRAGAGVPQTRNSRRAQGQEQSRFSERGRNRDACLRCRALCSKLPRRTSRKFFPVSRTRRLPSSRARILPPTSRRSAGRIRLSGPARRKSPHARHRVEFVAIPRPRARRQRDDHEFRRRRHRSGNRATMPKKRYRGHRAPRKMLAFWASPGRRSKSLSGNIRARCRSTISATGTSSKQFATQSAKLPDYFSPEIIWKDRRVGKCVENGVSNRGSGQQISANARNNHAHHVPHSRPQVSDSGSLCRISSRIRRRSPASR